MTQACDLSAVEARRLIGAKQLSAVELLRSCIERIEAVNPTLNAMVATCYERAEAEARRADAATVKGEPLGALHGLPVGIKDLNNTEGLRTVFGSPIFKDNVPSADEVVVAAVRKAGAIVIGKTNVPEFGAGANTTNPVYGPTGNPFDPKRICGGSSGGSAVALATNMVPIATGSDTGGSLRTPSALCGVIGFRVSPGLVPTDKRSIGWTTYGIQGPMGRTVADTALLLSAMAGSDLVDPLSGPVDPASFRDPPAIDLSRLRVAFTEDLGFAPVAQSIRKLFRERTAKFRSVFRTSAEACPDFGEANKAAWIIRGVHFVAAHKQNYEKHRDLLGPNVLYNVEAGLKMTAPEIAWAMAEQTQIYRRYHAFMENYDLLICPAASVPPFPVEQLYCAEIDGRKLDNYVHWIAITYGLTLTGAAVITMPLGLDHTGTPFGVQLATRRGGDRFLLGAAQAIEQHLASDPELRRPTPDIAALSRRARA
jgi:amidase